MGQDPPNIYCTDSEMDHSDKPVIIPSYIKNKSVIPNKINRIKSRFYILKIFPIRLLLYGKLGSASRRTRNYFLLSNPNILSPGADPAPVFI